MTNTINMFLMSFLDISFIYAETVMMVYLVLNRIIKCQDMFDMIVIDRVSFNRGAWYAQVSI